jgi:hypothetical protein
MNRSEKAVVGIILFVILACLCFGADYSRFERQGMAMVNGERTWSTWYIAAAECPVAMLDEVIPQEALTYFYGECTDEEG